MNKIVLTIFLSNLSRSDRKKFNKLKKTGKLCKKIKSEYNVCHVEFVETKTNRLCHN